LGDVRLVQTVRGTIEAETRERSAEAVAEDVIGLLEDLPSFGRGGVPGFAHLNNLGTLPGAEKDP
jgi:hypothetical protein